MPGTFSRQAVAIMIAAAVAIAGRPAHADGPFYTQFEAGAAFGLKSTKTVDGGPGKTKFDDTPIVGLGLGYVVPGDLAGFRLRTELAVDYFSGLPLKSSEIASDGFGNPINLRSQGKIQSVFVSSNAWIDIPTGTPLVPYVGGGLGWAHNRLGQTTQSTPGSNDFYLTGRSHDNLAWTAGAGVSYPVADALSLDIDYRYTRLGSVRTGDRVHFTDAFGDAGSLFNPPNTIHLQVQAVLVGFRWSFGGEEPEPVPAAAPPAPPASPLPPPPMKQAEAQRSYQVFFDFDQSLITKAAAETIAKAAAAAKSGESANITVVGHTDTVGSVKYNQALSERRASAVKEQLVADGVPTGEIATSGVGKSELLVATKDGVREPQNRRAEITIQ